MNATPFTGRFVRPCMEGARSLRALRDLHYVIRYETMGFAVYHGSRFFVGRLDQAVNLTRFLIESIPQVLHPVLALHLEVCLVGARNGFSR